MARFRCRISRFSLLPLSLPLILAVLTSTVSGQEFVSTAPPFQDEVPEGARELAEFQTQIREVVNSVLPCTVALRMSGRGGEQGSGVVVNPEGLVLTAGHVIMSPGRTCTVTFPDGKNYLARSLGADHQLDAGMVQILEGGPFPFVPLADRRLNSGEWCIATGHPGGLEVGRPPVVRLGRVLRDSSRWGFIRTDCQIIRGDSGGPLFDLDGNLIGIHSRLEQRFSANYHVPMKAFQRNWDVLQSGRRQGERPFLGVQGETTSNGCRITEVVAGTGAARAGVQEGDLLVSFNGEVVEGIQDLISLIGAREVDEEVELIVLRDGRRQELTARLGRRD